MVMWSTLENCKELDWLNHFLFSHSTSDRFVVLIAGLTDKLTDFSFCLRKIKQNIFKKMQLMNMHKVV